MPGEHDGGQGADDDGHRPLPRPARHAGDGGGREDDEPDGGHHDVLGARDEGAEPARRGGRGRRAARTR